MKTALWIVSALSLAACSTDPGGGGGPTPGPPAMAALCDGVDPRDDQTFDHGHVISIATGGGFRSCIDDLHGGSASVEWAVAAGSSDVTWRPAHGAPLGPLHLDGVVPDNLAGVTVASYVVFAAAAEGSLSPDSFTGANAPGSANHAGCDPDWLQPLSCTRFGGCCDDHDTCITANCRGPGDVTSVIDFLRRLGAGVSAACAGCHTGAMGCFLHRGLVGGPPSACCAQPSSVDPTRNQCGDLQECMVADQVVTDPCACITQACVFDTPDACPQKQTIVIEAQQAMYDADHLINIALSTPYQPEDAQTAQRIQDDLANPTVAACLAPCVQDYQMAHQQALLAKQEMQANNLQAANAAITQGDQDLQNGRACFNGWNP